MAKKKKVTQSDVAYVEGEVIAYPQEDKYTAERLFEGWQKACSWFDSYKRPDFDYAEKVSVSKQYGSDLKTMSQVIQTDTENAVRALVAKDIVSIAMKKPFAKIEGFDYKDYPKAKFADKGIETLFDRMPDFWTELVDFLYQRRVYGTAIGKVIWRDIYREISVIENGEKVTKKVLSYSGPIVQCVDVKENFRIESDATKLNGSWKYHRYITTYGELKQKQEKGLYKNVEKVTKKSLAKNAPQGTNAQPFSDVEGPAIPMCDDSVECVECWSPDDSKRYVLALGGGPVLIFEGPNGQPYAKHPFFVAAINKLPKKFYGRGSPEVCRAKQEWLDQICNMINDVTLQNASPMFSDPNGEYNYSTLPYEPWGVVHADLKPFNKPNLPAEVFALRQELQRGIEEDSGASRISTSMGMNSAINNMKANVYIGAKQASSERHAYDLFMLDDIGLTEMVERCVLLMQALMADDVWMEMTGFPKETISWKSLPYNLTFKPLLGIDAMSKEGMQQNLMYLLTQVVPVAAKVGLNVDLMEMINMAFEVAGLDPERFIKSSGIPVQGDSTENPGVESVGAPSGAGIPLAQTVNQYRPQMGEV